MTKFTYGKLSGYIESIDTKNISENDIKKITEIEQDMWAREDGIGEYIKCVNCNKIHSKEKVYHSILDDLKIQTVAEIENILNIDSLSCPCCFGKTEYIYNRNIYIEEIRSRYSNTIESFLTVYRDEGGIIRGFIDGYIDNFENIFDNEFKFHFNNNAKEKVKSRFGISDKGNILTVSSLGTDFNSKNLYLIYELIKSFFNYIDEKYDNISGLIESIVGSSTYLIFKSMGADLLNINGNYDFVTNDLNDNYETDILFQKDVVKNYKINTNKSLRQILKNAKKNNYGIIS